MSLAALIADDLAFMDDVEAVTFTNPDATTKATNYALKRVSSPGTMKANEFDAVIVNVHWHVRVSDMGTFVPARDGKIVDSSGNTWFINQVTLATRATRYQCDTTLEGGKALR